MAIEQQGGTVENWYSNLHAFLGGGVLMYYRRLLVEARRHKQTLNGPALIEHLRAKFAIADTNQWATVATLQTLQQGECVKLLDFLMDFENAYTGAWGIQIGASTNRDIDMIKSFTTRLTRADSDFVEQVRIAHNGVWTWNTFSEAVRRQCFMRNEIKGEREHSNPWSRPQRTAQIMVLGPEKLHGDVCASTSYTMFKDLMLAAG